MPFHGNTELKKSYSLTNLYAFADAADPEMMTVMETVA